MPARLRVILAGLLSAACLLTAPVIAAESAAQDPYPGAGPAGPVHSYTVRPGDTLQTIATWAGVSTDAVQNLNGIRDPRLIYPGQRLALPGATGRGGTVRALTAGESLSLLSRASGIPATSIAKANGLLAFTDLPVGLRVWLPEEGPIPGTRALREVPDEGAPRVSAAAISGTHLWDVLWLNSAPMHAGQTLLVPDDDSEARVSTTTSEPGMPPPLAMLSVSPQPVARGETVVITIATTEPVGCRVQYFEQDEPCITLASEDHFLVFAGLPPMVTPGNYVAILVLSEESGDITEVPIPLRVAAGRYDYERIDLPPDRASLLDPALSQRERDLIAQMRTVRSPVRLWEYPFQRPIDAAVTSYFGSRRSYGYGFGSFHAGSDFDGVGGEPVLAPASGTVILAEPLVVRGNAILLDHGWGVVSGFWHLSEIGVEVGQRVMQGERVGALGNTGLSTGAHLHWELWVNGASVNALTWLEPDGPGSAVPSLP